MADEQKLEEKCVFYPLLGGLVAEVQGCGVPVHSYISVSYRGSVLRTLYCAASTEPETHRQTGMASVQRQALATCKLGSHKL